MSNIYYISDTHYGHKNIVRGCSEWDNKDGCRDFDTLEEHNDAIIDGINSVVKDYDVLIHVGDVAFGGKLNVEEFLNRIYCKNVHLIYGNHDQHIRKHDYLQKMFMSCKDFDTFYISGKQIVLCHYALQVWENNHRGAFMLHGHSHGHLDHSNDGKILDLCVEDCNYKPWSFNEIVAYMEDRPIVARDHHQ